MGIELSKFEAAVQTGDVVLTGRRYRICQLVQWGSGSRYSHAAVVVDGAMIESKDPDLTPTETDEGCRRTPFSYFLERDDDMTHMLILRPTGVDAAELARVAARLVDRPAPYPTVGVVLLGLCLLNEKITSATRVNANPLVRYSAKAAGDGRNMMQCSELAAILLHEAGVAVDFEELVLQRHVDHLERVGRLGTGDNNPAYSNPDTTTTTAATAASAEIDRRWHESFYEWISAYRTRSQTNHGAHFYDFVLPADLERSPSFHPVRSFEKVGASWIAVEA